MRFLAELLIFSRFIFVFISFVGGDSSGRFLMPQSCGECGHRKPSYDNHITCLSSTLCSRDNTCGVCAAWPTSFWELHSKRRSYASRMANKAKKRRGMSSRSTPATLVVPDDRGDDSAESSVQLSGCALPPVERVGAEFSPNRKSSPVRQAGRSGGKYGCHATGSHSAGESVPRDSNP